MDHSLLTPLDDSFEQLDPQRQEAVVRASVEAFGRHAYKDASTDDIARAAGMSKGLLFNMSRTLSRGNEGPSQENLSRLGPFYHHPMISSDRLCHQTDARIRSLIFAG